MSTGVIGHPLPMDIVRAGISAAAKTVSPQGFSMAAEAIMTTDLVMKTARVRYHQGKRPIVIGGIAKGSGMIEPDMATMLAFLFTDAAVEPRALKAALREAGGQTFNSITVDGECSTNDCAIVLANGAAGNTPMRENTPAGRAFLKALTEVCQSLAIQIVEDGEGATKLIEVLVEGAVTDRAARRMASAIANSNLVKTAVFGEDPNWGRILCAAGHAGVPFKPDRIDIAVNAMQLVKGGVPVPGVSLRALQKRMRNKFVQIRVHLHSGSHQAKMYTCDLSYDYVRINAEYTT